MYMCVMGINVASFYDLSYWIMKQFRRCVIFWFTLVYSSLSRKVTGNVFVCYGYQCCLFLRFVLLDYEAVSKVCYFLVYFGIF